jgi:hypothetical protein
MSGVVYYAAMSLDGYIAEADDTIEWLTGFEAVPPADGFETVEGGYGEFYEGIDALVTGRSHTSGSLATFSAGGHGRTPASRAGCSAHASFHNPYQAMI